MDLIFYTETFMGFLTAAFAAVVYLRTVNVDGSITVSLLAAKSEVTSFKTFSVPLLKLSAALLLAHLTHFARSELPNFECHCWTDFTITLAWLSQSPSRFLARKSLPPIVFRLCNHSSLEYFGVCTCSNIHQSRELRFTRCHSRSFRDTCFLVVRPSMVTLSSRIQVELVSFGTLRDSSRTTFREEHCTLHPIGISRRVILCGQNCYELPFSKSITTLPKNLQANTATLPKEI